MDNEICVYSKPPFFADFRSPLSFLFFFSFFFRISLSGKLLDFETASPLHIIFEELHHIIKIITEYAFLYKMF